MSESNGHVLNRADILGLAQLELPREPITVQGYGTTWIRGLSAEEREIWEGSPKNRLRATMLALAACDEAGKPLFSLKDVNALAALPAAFTLPLFDAAIRLSKVGQEDISGLEKSSGATPDESSLSNSRVSSG